MKTLLVIASVVVAGVGVDGAARRQAAPAPVTFARDIAPIVYRACSSCHHAGGSGPFNLVTYEDVRRRAALIARATSVRYMPPWKPDGGDFVGERRLSDAEIAAFARWAADGTPEGDAADYPPPPRFTTGWLAGEPDLVVTLPEYLLRADGADVFRNFVVPIPGPRARFVRGLEFRPGSRAVHHANIRIDPTPASRRLDQADPEPGYEGTILRSADYPDGYFLGWTPGQAPPLGPADQAWRLESGSDFVVQLHMRPTGKIERVQPAIALYFSDQPPTRTPAIFRLGRQHIDIPPAAEQRISDAFTLPVDVDVRAIQPHAHYRAKTLEVWATPKHGARRPLLTIRDWDFNWQDQYRYREPIRLPAGTKIEMQYLFDNTAANARNPDRPPSRVSWGWRSSDEMADVWIQVTTDSAEDRARLGTETRRKMAAEDAIGCETLIAREPAYAALRNDAAALYLELGRPERALVHFEAVRKLQPGSASAEYNVGVALEALGRNSDAASHYEAAVRLDADYSAAHNNLGNMRLAAGRVEDAFREYQRAVECGPANAEAHNNLGSVVLAAGDPRAAVGYLEEAVRLRPAYPEAHFNLARAYAASGRTADARREAAVARSQATAGGKTELLTRIVEQFGKP